MSVVSSCLKKNAQPIRIKSNNIIINFDEEINDRIKAFNSIGANAPYLPICDLY